MLYQFTTITSAMTILEDDLEKLNSKVQLALSEHESFIERLRQGVCEKKDRFN